MEISSIINTGGWRAAFIQIGLVVFGGFSIVILLSFGGQFIVAPGLLPAQWLVARSTAGLLSRLFSILGGLLLLEVVPLAAVVLVSDSIAATLGGVVVAMVGAFAFYRTSQERQ
ncbi:MAG: hypothetical protein WBV06_15980 [Acidimicrobiia bacterium]